MRILSTAALLLTGACSNGELAGEAIPSPDSGVQQAQGCLVQIQYPPTLREPVLDFLVYDGGGRLQQHQRSFADGLTSQREWTWNDEGTEARREWFDGTRVTTIADGGRIASTKTSNEEGEVTWIDELSYSSDGILDSRLITRVSDATPWVQSNFIFDGSLVRELETISLVDPSDTRKISYRYEDEADATKVIESHDIDADGRTDFKIARLFDSEGRVHRAIDAEGRLITYDYEGGDCNLAVRSWFQGDPFFVDM